MLNKHWKLNCACWVSTKYYKHLCICVSELWTRRSQPNFTSTLGLMPDENILFPCLHPVYSIDRAGDDPFNTGSAKTRLLLKHKTSVALKLHHYQCGSEIRFRLFGHAEWSHPHFFLPLCLYLVTHTVSIYTLSFHTKFEFILQANLNKTGLQFLSFYHVGIFILHYLPYFKFAEKRRP